MEIIKLEGITKVYRTTEVETTALENVNLTVRKGEFLSIMAIGMRKEHPAQSNGIAGSAGSGKKILINETETTQMKDGENGWSSGTKCWDSFSEFSLDQFTECTG